MSADRAAIGQLGREAGTARDCPARAVVLVPDWDEVTRLQGPE
jgi:hypothetical protein